MDLESCNLEELCASLGGSIKLLIELRERLQDWLKLQPHLPQEIPKTLLEYFILGTKLSLEQAKHKLDMFYTIRGMLPDFYTNRDPKLPEFSQLCEKAQVVFLPKLTPEKYRVCIIRVIDVNSKSSIAIDFFKYWLMLEEILMHDSEARSSGGVYILDHLNITLSVLAKFTPPMVKKFETALTETYALRIKGYHQINTGPVSDTILSMLKSVLKPKLAARITVHGKNDFNGLHEVVSKSILPVEYGGDGPSMDELTEFWYRKACDNRDWFLKQEKILTNESLRSGPTPNADNLFGFVGSFRKLDVD